jgi:hypothetical protein
VPRWRQWRGPSASTPSSSSPRHPSSHTAWYVPHICDPLSSMAYYG